MSQHGHAAIGIGGVDCWGKNGVLCNDLADIDWSDRDVFIVFDYDPVPSTRLNVNAAMRRLANVLRGAGVAKIYNVELPPGDDGSKMGADDFLVQYSGKELQKLIDQADPVSDEATRNTIIKIINPVPPKLGKAAYLGFVGKFLRAVAPYTEATDAGILAHLLPAVGTLIGPGFYVWSGNKQPPRVNFVLVGPTNSGRKGTSLAPVDLLMQRVDAEFWNRQRVNGLSSGEGLIQFVADRQEKDEDGNLVSVPVEKRVCVIEEEFSRVLANIRREGNILSQIIRSAFDSGNLATLTVIPRKASGAHISIVGHITPEELAERLDHIEMANGFGNRFLWLVTKSDKVMPSTAPIPDKVFIQFEKRLRTLHTLGAENTERKVQLSKAAQNLWERLYPVLREDRPGLAGAMVSRGSPIVLRLALIYAILNAKIVEGKLPDVVIGDKHLRAAQAVWNYCRTSAERLFQNETGDKFCDKLLQLISNGPMTKNDLNNHLSVKQKAGVDRALEKLESWNLVKKTTRKHQGAGRPAKQWELA